jgi:hypothetical protein
MPVIVILLHIHFSLDRLVFFFPFWSPPRFVIDETRSCDGVDAITACCTDQRTLFSFTANQRL